MLLTVRRSDHADRAGSVGLEVDYGAYVQGYGGDFGSRLRLVRLPACALTTPDVAACRTGTPVAAVNDSEHRTLTAAAVPLPPAPAAAMTTASTAGATVLAVTTGTSGDHGDYKATSLSPSSTWETSLNAGTFSWSYDMPVPLVPGGLSPNVGISYDSGGIDGRTNNTNNQSSWVGDGFALWPGYIERSYKPCADDGAPLKNGAKPGDLCWGYDNATLSLNGNSGDLVQVDDTTWKLRDDNGTRIERLHGSSTDARDNGDNDQEYWRVTTTNGTQYYFGYNKLPGWTTGKETTDSAWTVPVFGNDANEPCHASTFDASWCQQAYRWNLDYVVDTHGNAIAYYYDKETNSYARNLTAADDTPYVRGGTLDRIEYGLRSTSVYSVKPLAKVDFTSSERCLETTAGTCDPSKITSTPQYWYDTPWDLNCNAGSDCTQAAAPTFWSRQRLTSVTTQVLNSGGTYTDVDQWKLDHAWGTADIDYQLLLSSIQHTGKTATPNITLPKVTFGYEQDANRLDKQGDGTAPFIKARLHTVDDETGGQTDVGYTPAPCDWNALPTPETNTTRCFPQYYTKSGDSDPTLQWFNKYAVASVTQTDRTHGSPDMVTTYDYLDGAAWHYDDDDGLTQQKYKTWSQWRGYRHVRVETGDTTSMKSQTDHYYLRGMNGDRLNTAGGTKSVTLDNGEGATIADWEALQGFEYRTESYSAPGGSVLAKTVNHGWFHQTASRTRDWGTVTANQTGTDRTDTYTSLDNGAGSNWRQTTVKHTMDTVAGRVTQTEDLGQSDISTDDRCTRTTYADNATANILSLPARVETVAVNCSAAPDRKTQVISDVRTAYDGAGYTAAPTKGDARYTATLKTHDGTTGTYLESGATYDSYGRQTSTTDLTANVTATNTGTSVRTTRSDGLTTTTSYSPATGIPTSSVVTPPPPVKGGTPMATTTALDPLRGLATSVTDTNGKQAVSTYDALGRVLKTWLPDTATNLTPNYAYTYTIADNSPVVVGTKTVNNDGSQDTSYQIYDGFLRPRQTQAPGPNGGSLVADTFYDGRGLVTKEFAPYYMQQAPGKVLIGLDKALSVETQAWHTYDGLGRETQLKHVAGNGDGGKVLDTTTTTYGGDRTTVVPPAGGTTTTTLTDARGQTSQLWQYHTPTATGTPDKTLYTYTPSGKLNTMTDADNNVWSYTYDQFGRQVTAKDPDKGTTTSAYDDRGRLLTVTTSRAAANDTTLAYVYDDLGRQLEEHSGSATGPKLAGWTYDGVTGARGQLSASSRYDNGKTYTTTVNAYSPLYRVTRSTTNIPTGEGVLSGNYQINTKYNTDGTLQSTGFPAEGSLPGEAVVISYDSLHRPIAAGGTSSYLTNVTYSNTGKPEQIELGVTGGDKTWLTNTYEFGTQRLSTSRVDRYGVPGVDRYTTYGYDDAGNILSMSDTSRDGTDNQCFDYDGLQRLTEAWAQGTTTCAATPSAAVLGGPAPYWQSYSYKTSGLRATQTTHDPSGDTTKNVTDTYTYPDSGQPRPHTLTRVDTTGPGTNTARDTYAYDQAGNTITRDTGGNPQTLTWDAEGHLATVKDTSGTTSYLYTPDGTRLIQRTPTATTLYIGSAEITVANGATKATATRYYDLGNGIQAVRTDDNKVSFVVPDHQGTGQLAVNATTLALQQRRTTPFGGPRGPQPTSWPGTKGYVGGTVDTTGLTHLGAREYDPATGRFISVDPLLDLNDPQSFNGYDYADNNPTTASDPSGKGLHCGAGTGDDSDCGTAITHGDGTRCHSQCQGDPTRGEAPPTNSNDSGGNGGSGGISTTDDGTGTPAPANTEQGSAGGTCGACHAPPGSLSGSPFGGLLNFLYHTSGASDFVNCGRNMSVKECEQAAITGAIILATAGEGEAEIAATRAARAGEKAAEDGAADALTQAAKNCVRNSFTPSTKVLMAGGDLKAIGAIKNGDRAEAADPQTGKHKGPRTVTATHVHHDNDLIDLTVQTSPGHTSTIHTTAHHPFWDDTLHTWIDAGRLTPGHNLETATDHHPARVTAVHTHPGTADMYNLTVDQLHTYYVLAGATPVLVHNSGGCMRMSSAIGQDSLLTKAAVQAGKNQDVQRDLDHLFEQLARGNMNPGRGSKALTGTDVTYARGRNGGRLFFRNVDGGIQIVGKADKGNESKVIARLKQIYGQ
jgi:RHS repeat-associated protein